MFFDVSDIQMQTMGLLNTQSVYSTLDTIYEHMGLFGVTLTLLSYSAKYTHITQKQNNISSILAPTNINIWLNRPLLECKMHDKYSSH